MKHKSSQSATCSTESSAKPSVRRWGVSMVAWALVLSMCAGLVFPAYATDNETEPTETTAATEATEAADSTETTRATEAAETTGAADGTEVTESTESTEADGLTPEEQAQAEAVLTALNALASADQVEANLAALEEDPEGYAAYYHQALAATQAVRDAYAALTDAQKELVGDLTKLNDLDWLVAREFLPDDDNQGEIRDYLDGDWAYITDLVIKPDTATGSGVSIYTGTAPWDSDDDPGNDSSELNSIVRTFDIVSYTIQFNTKLRDPVVQQGCGGIKEGRLYFEFILPGTAQEAQFDTGSMGWLQTYKNISYEVIATEVNGAACQVLRGSFILTPTGANASAIGASTNELFIVARVLRMNNGATIAPTFTLWLEHNDVGVSYHGGDTIPTALVCGLNHVCAIHAQEANQIEAATVTAPEITVSARPMFNLAIAGVDARNTKVGTYDFNAISDTDAINYGLGAINGRLNGYGLQLVLQCKKGQGMRGAEFPDENTPITFDIILSTEFDPSGDLPRASEPDYMPLFWSGSGNNDSAPDQRPVNTQTQNIGHVPHNQYSPSYYYCSCKNGGVWNFTQSGDRIHVTITDFEFDPTQLPYAQPKDGIDSYHYYKPDADKDARGEYWYIETAVFSAGELWIVQPYTAATGNNAGQHISEKYNNSGMFYTRVEAANLRLKAADGTLVDTEVTLADNVKNDGQYLTRPGNISMFVVYLRGETRIWNNTLSTGCFSTDADYTTVGSDVTLEIGINHDNAEDLFTGVGYDMLIKFDDTFFLPDNDSANFYVGILGNTKMKRTLLWAALPDDHTGWSDDEHMKMTTMDDLVYYPSLDALYADSKVPVGALVEMRGVCLEGGMNHIFVYLDGTVRSDCPVNQTYMITQNSYAWQKQDVAEAALAYYNLLHPDAPYTDTYQLTDSDYEAYMREAFPSRAGNTAKMFPDGNTDRVGGDYPEPFFRQDYYYTSNKSGVVHPDGTIRPTGSSELKAAAKATYPNGVYTPGYGAPHFEDSCLVIPCETTVHKSVAQTEASTQAEKVVYDVSRGQRTVDYRLDAGIQRTVADPPLDTIIYVEDILPVSLNYLENTAYLGGTYTQDPTHQKPGECTGGIPFVDVSVANVAEPNDQYPCLIEITPLPNGSTRLLFKFKAHLDDGQSSFQLPIYFSCSIGTPGIESTDVVNGQGITNSSSVWSTRDCFRARTAANGNAHSCGISILKTSAVSLSKISNRLVAELNDELSFTMNVGNNSNTGKTSLIVETLPFREMDGTKFNGPLTVSSFHAATVDSDSQPTDNNFVFYYTTEPDYAGLRSADISALAQAQGISLATWLESSGHWHPLTFESTTETVSNMTLYPASNLPEVSGHYEDGTPRQITSIVALGELKPNTTMKMHISLGLDKGQPGDYLVNFLSQESLSCYARTQIVKRSLSGLCWLDSDKDGIQDADEAMLSGINVTLVRLEGASYVPVCYPGTQTPITIQPGQLISVNAASADEAEAYGEGLYKFTELPAGTYGVIFESGDTSINDYTASPVGAGTNTEADSDGIPTYNGATLLNTQITGIVMDPAASLSYGIQDSRYHDSGFYPTAHYELPLTGGVGTGLFIIPGFLLTTGAALGLRRKKNKR